MVTEADRFIAANLIKDMWKRGRFDICDYRKCLELLELPRPQEYEQLSKYHCVSFDQMPKGFPDELLGVVLSTLTRLNVNMLVDDAFRRAAELNADRMLSVVAE